MSVWKAVAQLLRLTGSAALVGAGVTSNSSGKDVAPVRSPDMLTSWVSTWILTRPSASTLQPFLTVALAGVNGTSPILSGAGLQIAVQACLVVDKILALSREEGPRAVLNYLCVGAVRSCCLQVTAPLLANQRTPVAKFGDIVRSIATSFYSGLSCVTPSPGYAQSRPSISESLNVPETYTAVHGCTFLNSLVGGSSQRLRRSAFSADRWYQPYPMMVYVALLAFNVFEAFGHTSSPLQDHPPAAASVSPRGRDVLAARVSYAHFWEISEPLPPRLAGWRLLTDSQLFFTYLVLETCEKTGGQRQLRSEAGYG
ncbi:hypothetical protein HPB48_005560 [Haemaphysalis longicornis]|uniref:Secreted protein n=1 Tax=Haemaphysalis longicornis TaxID=44386 RepID=A0A9J6GI48_HAELO|nr:hypothetical protein HPB48_005560 [Haemaphysalis longicornis]